MSDDQNLAGELERDEVIAYLDGELEPSASREFELRLKSDPQLQRRLHEHQEAWDLLDELPRAQVDDSFTQTTIEMVAVSVAADVEKSKNRGSLRQRWLRLVAAASLIAAIAGGFAVSRYWLSLPDRRLVEDLPVIENLDAYRHAESIEFLRALESEGLFTAEVEDAL